MAAQRAASSPGDPVQSPLMEEGVSWGVSEAYLSCPPKDLLSLGIQGPGFQFKDGGLLWTSAGSS